MVSPSNHASSLPAGRRVRLCGENSILDKNGKGYKIEIQIRGNDEDEKIL
jgi:hypothetical protein